MDRAKKMVLISTDNLERLQEQHRNASSSTAPSVSTPSLALGRSNTEDGDTVRTPGTVLSRLDAEMYRILNSPTLGGAREKWKLYREVLQRYLHFFREKKKRLLRSEAGDNAGGGGDGGGGGSEDNSDKTEEVDDRIDIIGEDIPDLERAENDDGAATELAAASPVRQRRCKEQKSIRGILNTVPKTYRAKARKLLTHLCDVAVPARLSWDRHGIVTIDGKVSKGSNIANLVNDALRERKTVRAIARVRFARLLRDVATPPEFVGNRELLEEAIDAEEEKEENLSATLRKTLPRATSTPVDGRSTKRAISETSSNGDREDRALFVTDGNRRNTRVSGDASKSTSKRRATDWNPYNFNETLRRVANSSFPSARRRVHKRAIAETSFTKPRASNRGPSVFITSAGTKIKTRVSSKSANKRHLIDWNPLQ